ncbi:MAG TPA: ORF6N domain-containing protein [Bacteroidota bacterium]|nr:ORF6N domain-containing protein [Bacteroidota bacterium]
MPRELIERRIFFIRGQKVMLDKDLADLYQIETFNLNKAVGRNRDRFPGDFMFQLSEEEFKNLIFHFGISSWGGTRKLPYAFTEHGVAMLSSVLRTPRAIHVNIEIVRAFVRIRRLLASNKKLKRRLEELEKKYDAQFKIVFDAIRQILQPPEKPKRRMGFGVEEPMIAYRARKKR